MNQTLIIVINFRCGKCGAWSFDETKGVCFLYTVNSCCGQREKQETNLQFTSGNASIILSRILCWHNFDKMLTNLILTSGYYCNHCWSTKNDCPCDLKDRLKVPLTEECKGVNQQSNEGAVTPQLTSSVVSFIYIIWYLLNGYCLVCTHCIRPLIWIDPSLN